MQAIVPTHAQCVRNELKRSMQLTPLGGRKTNRDSPDAAAGGQRRQHVYGKDRQAVASTADHPAVEWRRWRVWLPHAGL